MKSNQHAILLLKDILSEIEKGNLLVVKCESRQQVEKCNGGKPTLETFFGDQTTISLTLCESQRQD